MTFKHPEILYFLILLLLPILVHLLQLRRFKKEVFTNVRFLKELVTQTTQSSKLKKWLLLATRLLLLAAIIIAFAQPFSKASLQNKKNAETIFLLDNSFSMQNKGKSGELLKRAIEDILAHSNENQKVSIVMMTEKFWNIEPKTIQSELQNLSYSSVPFNLNQLLTEVEFKKPAVAKNICVITDAINPTQETTAKTLENTTIFLAIQQPQTTENCAVKNVSIAKISENFYDLKIEIENFGKNKTQLPVSLFKDEQQQAKTIVNLQGKTHSVIFTIAKDEFQGYVKIDDQALPYDNTLYFSINTPEKQNIVAIGTPENNEFLTRIFTNDEFNFTHYTSPQINYSELEKQQIIVVNELESLSENLSKTLFSAYSNGASIVFIPHEKTDIQSLNNFIKPFTNTIFTGVNTTEQPLTKIVFKHPLFANVFEKEVKNFQYPTVKKVFNYSNSNSLPALQLNDGTHFLSTNFNQVSYFYLFYSPINQQVTNFKNAPLIVPTFYAMAQFGNMQQQLFYEIGEKKQLLINQKTSNDQVLTLTNKNQSLIPQQQNFNEKIALQFDDYIEKAGNYTLFANKNPLKNISFNYARTESNLAQNTEAYKMYETIPSVEYFFTKLIQKQTEQGYWKIFVWLTLLFLLLELLIQKLVK